MAVIVRDIKAHVSLWWWFI